MKLHTPIALGNEGLRQSLGALGIVLANTDTISSLSAGDVSNVHGQICLANDSLLRQSEYIEELTAFAISYDSMVGNRLRQLRDFLAPPRSSNSRIVRLTTYDENEPWETVDYTRVKRGILGDFAQVRQRKASKSDLQCPNRGLSVLLDRDQLKDKPEWQQTHTKWLIDIMMRATVLESIALHYASAVQAAAVWNPVSNPDLEIKNDILTLADTTGFYPLCVAYGDRAALKRQTAYEQQLTAGSLARAEQFTEEQIATALGVDRVLINAERYQATSTTKQELLGSNVLIFTSVEAEGPMDPSNQVRHIANAAYGGGDYAVYVTEHGTKLITLTVENYELLHQQHTSGEMQIAVA